jgi:geranylgeranyl pyrophosphate synthase
MDDDDMRRNQPSLHKAFDEGLALLTGDFLLTLAFEIISLEHLLSHEIRLKLIQCLSYSAGVKGMIGGQVLDILKKKQKYPLDKNTIDCIHQGKTGALFTASFLFAGFIAKLSTHQLETLKTLSRNFGKAFQYMDDMQDYSTKKDEYINIVSILGKDKTLEEISNLEKKITDLIETFSQPLPLLKQLLQKNFSLFHQSFTHLV